MAVLTSGAGFHAPFWKYFENILAIPHGSKNEQALGEYIRKFAEERKLSVDIDAAGNVVVRKPATSGYEDHPALVLQGHLDMVCEKNEGTQHDFEKDPIRPVVDGDWLKADGTTLGADNGVGVAAILAVLDDTALPHPAIEALFTVDEETGLNGAMSLTPGSIQGRRLINLDSEDEGVFYFGCAGGRNTSGSRTLEFEAAQPDSRLVRLRVEGLSGGHSGGEIHRRLGNAIQLGAQVLCASEIPDMGIVSLHGGGKHNAIPREFEVLVAVPADAVQQLRETASRTADEALRLYSEEKEIRILCEETGEAATELIRGGMEIVRALLVMPHGVQEMSPIVEGMVETSTNLAAVSIENRRLYILTSQRSAVEFKRDMICSKVKALMLMLGCEVEYESEYPAWEPKPESELLKLAGRVYSEVAGKEPHITAVHAGLECGVIDSKIPGMDMVSFGPDLRGPHSPDERISISSGERFWTYLKELLKNL